MSQSSNFSYFLTLINIPDSPDLIWMVRCFTKSQPGPQDLSSWLPRSALRSQFRGAWFECHMENAGWGVCCWGQIFRSLKKLNPTTQRRPWLAELEVREITGNYGKGNWWQLDMFGRMYTDDYGCGGLIMDDNCWWWFMWIYNKLWYIMIWWYMLTLMTRFSSGMFWRG